MKSYQPTSLYAVILAFTALLLVACQKEEKVYDYTYECVLCEEEEEQEQNATTNEAAKFLANHIPQNQLFTGDASEWLTYEGSQGTKITISPNSFADKDGKPVSGEITLVLNEIFTPSQMILANKMTTSNGQLLSSGGELYLNVQQNGEDLELINGKSISIKVPADKPDPDMALFTGGQDANGDFTWVTNNTTVQSCNDSSSITFPSGYCFDLKSLFNWINCDYFYSDPRPLTEVEIVTPQGYDTSNTMVFAYIPSINSITDVRLFENQSYWIKGGYRLPVGLDVSFIAVYADGQGTYGYAYQQNTIVNNHQEILQFTTMSEQDLLQFLASL